MAKFVLKGARIFAGGADLTSQTNKVEISAVREEKDVTTFGSVDANNEIWKEVLGGLGSAKATASGFWEAADSTKVDNDMWSAIGTGTGGPFTVCPTTANVGDLAWVLQTLRTSYQLGGAPGDVAPFSMDSVSTLPMARGKVLNAPGTARTATGNGTAVQLGAVAAGKSLYANLHVLSVSGTSTPTITVKIQSDDNSGFTSATDRITFTAATAVGGQSSSVAGAITDDYWRVSYTISGTNPSFLLIVTAGIV